MESALAGGEHGDEDRAVSADVGFTEQVIDAGLERIERRRQSGAEAALDCRDVKDALDAVRLRVQRWFGSFVRAITARRLSVPGGSAGTRRRNVSWANGLGREQSDFNRRLGLLAARDHRFGRLNVDQLIFDVRLWGQ